MGLIIKPKSKLGALSGRVFNWASLKMVIRNEPLIIAWVDIHEIQVLPHPTNPQYLIRFQFADGLQSKLQFRTSDVLNYSEFNSYLNKHPVKVITRFTSMRENLEDLGPSYLKYGAYTFKYMIVAAAFIFMFYQIKYFGLMLIDKYQFLIKTGCNQQCAHTFWQMTTTLLFTIVYYICLPFIPLLFYKKIYNSVLKSKNVQVINSTLTEAFMMTAVGLFFLLVLGPKLWESTSKYSNILASYNNNTLQAKLSQKIEMASKRKFQGDVDEVEILEDQHEE